MRIQPFKALKNIDADLDDLLKNQPFSEQTVGFFELYVQYHYDAIPPNKKLEYLLWYIDKGIPYHPDVLLLFKECVLSNISMLDTLPIKKVYKFLSTMEWPYPLWSDARWNNYLFYLLQNHKSIESYRNWLSSEEYSNIFQRYISYQKKCYFIKK